LAGTISVKFYGLLRRRVRQISVEVEGDGQTILALMRSAETAAGGTFLDELLDTDSGLLTGTIILINGENVRFKSGLETRVATGDRVDLFSPAGGG
jgi:molybdopterin converting factor small subunit